MYSTTSILEHLLNILTYLLLFSNEMCSFANYRPKFKINTLK